MSVAAAPSDYSRYRGYRFPPEIIAHAVWLYFRFHLSFRDVQDLLAERGIIVSHEAIRQWCAKFGADFAVGMLAPFQGLLIGLQAVAQVMQEFRHHTMAGLVALRLELPG
jgi:putative transposase